MLRIFGKSTLLAAALLSTACFSLLAVSQATAQERQACPICAKAGVGTRCPGHHNQTNCRPQTYSQPNLFYNYYVPGTCGGVPAAMYVAPQPVPPLVGQTYYTYQPFMPHELLYQHHRTYYRYYDEGRGLTRTHVSWSRNPISSGLNHLWIAR